MEPIPISIPEKNGFDRHQEPIRLGLPLQKGQCFDVGHMQLKEQGGTNLQAQFRPLAHWPDGSVRWVETEAQLSVAAWATKTLYLEGSTNTERSNAQRLQHATDVTGIKIGNAVLAIDDSTLSWGLIDSSGHRHHQTCVLLEDSSGHLCTGKVNEWRLEHSGDLSTKLKATGWWQASSGTRLARFECTLIADSIGRLAIDVCIHNPRRAKHPGGLWDLGDPGSIQFRALGVRTGNPDDPITQAKLSVDGGVSSHDLDLPMTLHQESSGGEHWDSRNHITASGKIGPRYRGYRLQTTAHISTTGDRASPVAEMALASGNRVSVSMPQFWQNFPSALTADQDSLTAWLFPSDTSEAYELQGGERKTQRVVLAYGQSLDSLRWTHTPLRPVIPAAHYEDVHAFPWFVAAPPRSPLDDLILTGLEGASSFFQKRETIDEYGWRNFGDLFADHETLYQEPGADPFISHYNNQYDAVFGFARQFALTGDHRWFELMDDLAKHVVDIDIYHTDDDRTEYNHGLFWHTDHYLDAHTCTHRTFSRHNSTSSTPGQLGGGPATEHCYTTGLMYHYLLTGTSDSRKAVLELAHWMTALHQGGNGLFAQILAAKKNEIPKLKAMLRGDQVSPHRFPFTRGTGNYLNTLLDAYILEPEMHWLEQAEAVIKQVIHPADTIDERGLLDTENGWSYLVLLASIARYLYVKEEAGTIDAAWQFAKDSFLHYTRWMSRHERPFLAETTGLEFANDTWTAQDVRKAMLMYLAAIYDPAAADQYRRKADEWLKYVTDRLGSSPESHFTRIQVILLQNYGPHLLAPGPANEQRHLPNGKERYQPPTLSHMTLIGQIGLRLLHGLINFRPAKEKTWLQTRLDR